MARFGPYELIERLGHGGMGEVYRAVLRREGDFEKPVVIKRILPARSVDPEFRRMFNREARVAALLNHQHIVQVYDYGREGDEFFLAMELVDGADLQTLTEALGRPPLPVTLAVLRGVARALDYAHRRRDADGTPLGIVHRDVSPGNVLLSREGEVKLTDFGLVTGGPADGVSDSGAVKGKYAYMSPEQTHGDPVDARSDLFSWGVLAYELLAGRRPFDGPVMEVLQAIRDGAFEPLPVAPWPQELVNLVNRCLSVHRDERPAGAAELVDALEALMAAAGVSDAPSAVAQWVHRALDRGTEPLALDRTEVGTVPLRAGGEGAAKEAGGEDKPAAAPPTGRRPWPLALALGVAALAVAALVLVRSGGGEGQRTGGWPPSGRTAAGVASGSSGARDAGDDALDDSSLGATGPAAVETGALRDELEPGTGTAASSLSVITTPAGARLRIDDVSRGTTPAEVAWDGPGTHTVRVEADGYLSEETHVLARPGVHTVLPITLRRLPRLSVDGTPDRARVAVSGATGEPAECVAPCVLELAPGDYTVRTSLDGWTTAEENVSVEGDRSFRFALARPPAAFVASWRSDDLRLRGGRRQTLSVEAQTQALEFASPSGDLRGSLGVTLTVDAEGRGVSARVSVRASPWCQFELGGRRADSPADLEIDDLGPGTHALSLWPRGEGPPLVIELLLREER